MGLFGGDSTSLSSNFDYSNRQDQRVAGAEDALTAAHGGVIQGTPEGTSRFFDVLELGYRNLQLAHEATLQFSGLAVDQNLGVAQQAVGLADTANERLAAQRANEVGGLPPGLVQAAGVAVAAGALGLLALGAGRLMSG